MDNFIMKEIKTGIHCQHSHSKQTDCTVLLPAASYDHQSVILLFIYNKRESRVWNKTWLKQNIVYCMHKIIHNNIIISLKGLILKTKGL